jgi:hypothetical protein
MLVMLLDHHDAAMMLMVQQVGSGLLYSAHNQTTNQLGTAEANVVRIMNLPT